MNAVNDKRPSVSHRRGWLLFVIKAVVTLGLLVWIATGIGIGPLLRQFRHIDGSWAAAALLLLIVQYAIMVARWDLVLRKAFGLHIGLRRLSLVFGLGEVLGSFLPSFVGLDAIRTLALARNAPVATVARSVLVDRVFGLAALLFLIAVTLPGFESEPALISAIPPLAVVSVGGLIALAILMLGADHWGAIPYLGRVAAPVARDLRAAWTDLPLSFGVIATGLAMHLLSVALVWSIGRMFGADLGLMNCLRIVPSALLISALPVSVGGWGLREGAVVGGFTLIGADAAAAGAASVGFGIAVILAGAIGIVVPWLAELGRRR
ncbi:MAG TPA: lysylphosphatidylglycerol synthase transmembrane domain-containing protein [Dongiaceae bacterium]|nr:lysylphosphatidylglycerol synthase transmembrane domain-containing protein [Dongiaceae bacterium]